MPHKLVLAIVLVRLLSPAQAPKVGDYVAVVDKQALLVTEKVVSETGDDAQTTVRWRTEKTRTMAPGQGAILKIIGVRDGEYLAEWSGDGGDPVVGTISRDSVALPERAIARFGRMIEKKPEADLYLARGIVHLHQKDYTAAQNDLDEAIRRRPKAGLAYRYRATLWDEIGEPEKAKRDRDKAGELGHNANRKGFSFKWSLKIGG